MSFPDLLAAKKTGRKETISLGLFGGIPFSGRAKKRREQEDCAGRGTRREWGALRSVPVVICGLRSLLARFSCSEWVSLGPGSLFSRAGPRRAAPGRPAAELLTSRRCAFHRQPSGQRCRQRTLGSLPEIQPDGTAGSQRRSIRLASGNAVPIP